MKAHGVEMAGQAARRRDHRDPVLSISRPAKYLMASAEEPATSRSVISRMPTAIASISFEDMPP
jgi:hypothetical protein